MPKKITQNINKDAGLMDLPKVRVPRSRWETKHSNYLTCNIGDIVPIYVDEVLPSEKRKVTMGMISHMTTPQAPLFNALYTEFRCFFVPNRLICDLLNGFSTRRSPWVKVFGEDPKSTSADIVVPLSEQKIPKLHMGSLDSIRDDFVGNLEAFGGVADALDMECDDSTGLFGEMNGLSIGAYELIYQYCYRNQNRESATNSALYKWLFNIYNRVNASSVSYQGADKFHKANREKDYFTGSQPFTQKGTAPNINIGKTADVVLEQTAVASADLNSGLNVTPKTTASIATTAENGSHTDLSFGVVNNSFTAKLVADLTTAKGVSIEELRLLIKTQELLEKDLMYGSDYASSLNAHFGTAPISLILEKPLELRKVSIDTQMQPIFQTSTTSSEPTILGTIGANSTTQSGSFEILPMTEFKEHGILMICAVHKAQNSYDSYAYKPKHLFKSHRFDFYTPELNDLGFQPVQRKEFSAGDVISSLEEAVSFNEAFAEYRYKFNKVHGMLEPSRNNALDFWTLCMSTYSDVESMYKQTESELDRAISVTSAVSPQFYDAYGFIEINDKPMSLHSIPGFDGVI